MIQIKNAAELEKMRKAAAISAAALKAGGEAIEPGITTAEIDKIIYDFIVRHGARPHRVEAKMMGITPLMFTLMGI